MVIFLYSVVGIFLLIIVLLTIPVRIKLCGKISVVNSIKNGNLQLMIGYKKRGLCINLLPEQYFTLGSYQQALFTFPLKKGKITPKKKQTDSKQSLGEAVNKKRIFKIIRSILKSLHWIECSLSGKLGMRNPMHSGMVFGIVHIMKSFLHREIVHIQVQPAFYPFMETDLTGTLHFRMSPLRTFILAVYTYLKHRK